PPRASAPNAARVGITSIGASRTSRAASLSTLKTIGPLQLHGHVRRHYHHALDWGNRRPRNDYECRAHVQAGGHRSRVSRTSARSLCPDISFLPVASRSSHWGTGIARGGLAPIGWLAPAGGR